VKDNVTALSSPLQTRSLRGFRGEIKPVVLQAASLAADRPKSGSVLFVEHSAARSNALKTLLEDLGYEVWTAKDLSDALALLERLEFAAMVVDPDGVRLDDEDIRLIAAIWPRLSLITPYGVLLESCVQTEGEGKSRRG
jgi:hypothetical protein